MRRALRIIWIIALLLGCGLYLLSCLAPFVNPGSFPLLGIIGLGFPACFIGMIILLWISFFVSRRQAVLISVCLLSGTYNIYNYVSFFPSADKTPDAYKEISIMTWNVKNFDLYSWTNNHQTKQKMLELIRSEDPDILLLQEFYTDDTKNFNTLKELQKSYPYVHFRKSVTLYKTKYWGLATFSKYPIMEEHAIRFSNSKHNMAIISEIEVNGTRFNVFNLHMQSIQFDGEDLEQMERVTEEGNASTFPLRRVLGKLKRGYEKRGHQADTLAQYISASKLPSIVCGDFNDSPNSYTYLTLRKGLQDAFRKDGRGIGNTYNVPFPSLRIDFILPHQSFPVIDYKVLREDLSDHYAVKAVIAVPKGGE
ncbi:endonuclease/exonuclease/phosphatase family protein [soil metagenome]